MRLTQITKEDLVTAKVVTEANVAAKIGRDPKLPKPKQLLIAMRHDHTLPKYIIGRLGPKPDENAAVQAWSDLLDKTLRSNNYGDLSADGKFDEWLTRLYVNGQADFEDINGEGGDALGAWKALSIRGKLKPKDQDFNRFTSISQLQRIRNDPDYSRELRRIADAEQIEKMKREREEIVLIDNSRFLVILPFNYGSCYTFGRAEGYQPNFCTSSSSGADWFGRYAPEGPIVSITDKKNINSVEGKWQFHAQTNQLVDGEQTRRGDLRWNDERFANLFPGLMKDIVKAIEKNATEIREKSKTITRNGQGYDIDKAVGDIKAKYPLSYASEAPEEKDGPGIWLITEKESGKSARVRAENREDAVQKLLAKYPDRNPEDFEFALQEEPPAEQPQA